MKGYIEEDLIGRAIAAHYKRTGEAAGEGEVIDKEHWPMQHEHWRARCERRVYVHLSRWYGTIAVYRWYPCTHRLKRLDFSDKGYAVIAEDGCIIAEYEQDVKPADWMEQLEALPGWAEFVKEGEVKP
jgi:hypothetical protein